jgi:HSP20 family molecular chaperone IbpA
MSQASLQTVPSNAPQASNGHRSAPTWRVTPHCDVYESDSAYLLVIDMPGASPDSLSVELTGNSLAIRAQRSPSSQGADVATTTFERHIELPSDVDGSSTSAKLQGGVLRVEIAKAPSARRVKIPVAAN